MTTIIMAYRTKKSLRTAVELTKASCHSPESILTTCASKSANTTLNTATAVADTPTVRKILRMRCVLISTIINSGINTKAPPRTKGYQASKNTASQSPEMGPTAGIRTVSFRPCMNSSNASSVVETVNSRPTITEKNTFQKPGAFFLRQEQIPDPKLFLHMQRKRMLRDPMPRHSLRKHFPSPFSSYAYLHFISFGITEETNAH